MPDEDCIPFILGSPGVFLPRYEHACYREHQYHEYGIRTVRQYGLTALVQGSMELPEVVMSSRLLWVRS